MASILTPELFAQVVDRALQEVVPQVTGIPLLRGGPPPSGELYTVRTVFEGDTQANLTMCADRALLACLTRRITGQEEMAPEDAQDAATELFNVLCGHVAVELLHTAKLKFRFRLPEFSAGRRLPPGHRCLFALNYQGGQSGNVQVIHHTQAQGGPARPLQAGLH